jgi:thiol-disulfide isomerase/thioredoxin
MPRTTLPGPPPKITTVTSIGDQPRPVVTGTPGNSVAADVDYVEDRPKSADRLSGRVVDPRGEPVPGAVVRLAIGNVTTGRTSSVTTDDAGRFTLHGLRPGTDYTVIAETEDEQGRVSTGRIRAQALEKGVEIALARSGRGAIVTPASNAKRVKAPDDDEEEQEGSTSSNGRVNDEDLPPAQPADDLEFSQRPSERLATEAPRNRATGASPWRRGGKEAPASDDTSTKPDSPATAPEQSTTTPLEDDGPNPLPPAREPAPASAMHNTAEETFEAQAPAPQPAPAPAQTQLAVAPSPTSSAPAQPAADEVFTAQPDPQPSTDRPASAPPASTPAQPPTESSPAQPSLTDSAPAQPSLIEPSPAGAAEPPKDAPANSQPGESSSATNPAPIDSAKPESASAPTETKPADTPVPAHDNTSGSTEPKLDEPEPATTAQPTSPADAAPAPTEPAPNTQASTPTKKKQTWGQLTQVSRPAVAAAIPAQPASSNAPQNRPRLLDRLLPKPAANPAQPGSLASCDYDTRGHRLVDFQLPDLNGKPVHFKDLDADFVLIDFWGSWCGPCLGAIPHLVELQNQHTSDRLKVIGIAYEDAKLPEAAKAAGDAAQRLGINYPVLLGGADGKACPVQTAFHVQAYPTMILLDRNGRILWREQGATAMSLARLDRVIASTVKSDVVRR